MGSPGLALLVETGWRRFSGIFVPAGIATIGSVPGSRAGGLTAGVRVLSSWALAAPITSDKTRRRYATTVSLGCAGSLAPSRSLSKVCPRKRLHWKVTSSPLMKQVLLAIPIFLVAAFFGV